MRQVQIGEHTLEVNRWDPKRSAPNDIFSYIDISSVSQETKAVNGVSKLIGAEAPSRARQLVRCGDILVSSVRPNLNAVAVVPTELDGATASTGFTVLRPDQNTMDGRYLYHWVRTSAFVADMTKRATGQSYPAVSDKIIKGSRLPLPPLDQQKRIAAILDNADHLRRLRQQAIDKLKTLGQSVFYEMFHREKNFEEVALASVCNLITDGTHHTPTYADEGIVFLSAKNVTTRRIDWQNVKFVPENLHLELRKRVSPQRNDVLLAKNGTTGVAALVDRDIVFDIYVSLALLRPGDAMLPKYLLYAVNSEYAFRQFTRSLKGVGVSNLHLVDIRKATVPLPPIHHQRNFVAIAEQIEGRIASCEEASASTWKLFRSLQHRAFQGEL